MIPPLHWLLLRGLTRDQHHWAGFADHLAARLPPGSRVLTPDLAGNGRRHRERSPARVAGMVQDFRDQLAADGIPGRVVLVAVSMGAMIAADWALRHPREVAGLVLINTSLRPHAPAHWRLRPGSWGGVLRLLCGRLDAQAAEAQVLAMTSATPPSPALLRDWAAWRDAHPVSRVNALRQLAAAAAFHAGAAPACPTLILASSQDQLVNPGCSRRLASAWGLPCQEHPWAGHDLTLDDPDWVAGEISGWAERSQLVSAAG